MQCRGPWIKSHTLPCLYPELPLTLGVGNLAVLCPPPSLSQIACPWMVHLGYMCVSGFSVCHLPVLATDFLSSHNPAAAPLISLEHPPTGLFLHTNLINWFYSSPSYPCPSLSPTIKYPSRWEWLCHAGGKLGVVAPTPTLHGNIGTP